ncbi:MAG: sigma-54 dependent transcriptional regulator [Nitrospiraceae bacterium]|nr:sigma-54 dependent transcriptional regulator [Nitrospiraceae bacterium]
MGKVLIVDDEGDLRSIVRDVLKDEGFQCSEAADGMKAMRAFRSDMPDAVLLDLNMPYLNGIDTMKELHKIDRTVPVIVLTAYGDIPTAVEAIKAGAYDFMAKPPEFDRLILTLKRAVERRLLEQEVERANDAFKSSLEHILGRGSAIKGVISQIKQVAHTDFSVIIQGETGTGKSVVAGAIQDLSRRAGGPFVSVDISLIPDHLVESELFGYRKGAFTGADRDKEGYFETAHRGSIFIDELENMSSQVQAKLLSVIERKKVFPLGCTTPVDIDIRLIAATNKDIRTSVRSREFREDLFYRLGEFIITLPPLRERIEDIPFFTRKFVFEASVELNKQIREISNDALAALAKYPWPGNLRELKNVMRRAVLAADGDTIDHGCVACLLNGEGFGQEVPFLSLREAVKQLERKMIAQALIKTGGNKSRAAELLDMSYKNLFDKVKEYNING